MSDGDRTEPRVSVVLGPPADPTWPPARRSIDAQDHPVAEVVVPPEGAGPLAVALHEGADRCAGELLMFCGGTDEYEADRVSSFARAWRRTGSHDRFWGFSRVAVVDGDGAGVDLAASGLHELRQRTLLAEEQAWLPELLRQTDLILTPANLVVASSLYRRSGGFVADARWPGWALALELLEVADPVVIPRPLYRLRVDPVAGLTGGEDAARRAFVRSVLRRQRTERARRRSVTAAGEPFIDHLRTAGRLRGPYSGG